MIQKIILMSLVFAMQLYSVEIPVTTSTTSTPVATSAPATTTPPVTTDASTSVPTPVTISTTSTPVVTSAPATTTSPATTNTATSVPTPVTPVAAPAVSSTAAPVSASQDVSTATDSILKKIESLQKTVSNLTASTPDNEKATTLISIQDLVNNVGLTNKQEIEQLFNLIQDCLKSGSFLTNDQRKVMSNWRMTIGAIKKNIAPTGTLIESIKASLDNVADPKSNAVKNALIGTRLLSLSAYADEKNMDNKTSLLSKINDALPKLYDKRRIASALPLFDLFTLLKKNFSAIKIDDDQLTNLQILSLLAKTTFKKVSTINKLALFDTIQPLVTAKTASFEKQTIIDMLGRFILQRKDSAAKELTKLQETLSKFAGMKDIFDDKQIQRFKTWQGLAGASVVLTASYASTTEALTAYAGVLDALKSPDAIFEQGLLANVLGDLFAKRATAASADIASMETFFNKVQQANVLSPNQKNVFKRWLDELDIASKMTKDPATQAKNYLDALLLKCQDGKDIELTVRLFNLLDDKTSTQVKDKSVQCLNSLFMNRTTLDAKMLDQLFSAVEQKTVGGSPFLTVDQLSVLKKWRDILKTELSKQATPTPTTIPLATPASSTQTFAAATDATMTPATTTQFTANARQKRKELITGRKAEEKDTQTTSAAMPVVTSTVVGATP